MKNFILVTGATSGIGKGVAQSLSLNKNVLLHGRNKEELEILSKDLKNTLYWCYDLSNVENISDSLKDFVLINNIVVEKFVHCAGVDNTLPAKSLKSNSIEELMKVNFYSAVEIINTLLKRSVNNNELKNILFISSISSLKAYRAKGAYSASKAALDAYMKVLSLELSPQIRVNSILPGAIKTKMTVKSFEDKKLVKHMKDTYPLGIGNIDNVVDFVEFYLSDKSSWVTGQQVVLDGGFTI
jgi:NAD(P)-dependent dehydrogenase (short-subunit alcohol dehydrogenase family)